MDSLGDKVAGAQSHVNRWVGSVRRSLHEALNLVAAAAAPERAAGEGPGRAAFKRTASFRQLASRGRESFRQFSVRSQRRLSSLRKRPAGGPEQPTPELDHLKQCFGQPSAEARDTDDLVQEADGRYGTWGDQHQSGDSFTPESPSLEGSMAPTQKPSPGRPASWYSSQRGMATATDRPDSPREQRSHSLDGSSLDASPAKPPPTEKGSPDFSFLEQTARLDSRVLKSRVLLGKRRQRHRAPISHTLRRSASGDAQPAPFSAVGGAASSWMFRDSTEEKPPRAGEEEEEEEPLPAERLFPAQPRPPLFPGLGPPALKAQLRKRQESEGRREETPPAPLCKSPKGPFPARGFGGRVLAATPEKEGRLEERPPPWLTELKSRRKQGQSESPI
uniref:KIAA1671 n=1 Tax=Laticauda laticaudata TaxID=8630 RepID=A0A8C5T0D7_LATLA